MSKQEELLRQACQRLAEEETNALEKSLNRSAVQEAEALYRRHRLKMLALIHRQGKKKRGAIPLLRIAACIALLAGAAYLSLHQPADPTPFHPQPSASIIPYYSSSPVPVTQSPTFTPSPTAIPQYQPTASPSPAPSYTPSPTGSPVPTSFVTQSPTYTPVPIIFETISPTFSPIPTIFKTTAPTFSPNPTLLITASPTFTPSPSPAPTLQATIRPTQAPTPSPTPLPSPVPLSAPQGWQGSYYLTFLPQGYQYTTQENGQDYASVTYTRQQDTIEFREYRQQQPVAIPAQAQVAYVQWGSQIALKAESADGVLLAWDDQERTFCLLCTEGDGMEIAASVKKLKIIENE